MKQISLKLGIDGPYRTLLPKFNFSAYIPTWHEAKIKRNQMSPELHITQRLIYDHKT
jgi:hypothetical protein